MCEFCASDLFGTGTVLALAIIFSGKIVVDIP